MARLGIEAWAELIEWSIDLLPQGAAESLDWIAALHGSFTRIDVRRLLGAHLRGIDLDSGIDALVEASLVSIDTSVAPARYRLFDTVRSHALHDLRARGVLRERFDAYADGVSAAMRERLKSAGERWDPHLLRDMAVHFDDIAAALRWCLANDADPERALSLCSALFALVQQARADEIAVLIREVFERWPHAVHEGAAGAIAALATLATAENLTGPSRAGPSRSRPRDWRGRLPRTGASSSCGGRSARAGSPSRIALRPLKPSRRERWRHVDSAWSQWRWSSSSPASS